ncbi:polysaccharide pyruvyl transferase WcaK-like protein [Sinorhizobium fredii]
MTPAVEAVLAALGESDAKRLSYEPVHSLHDVLSQVARTDLVVVPRFHNVVAALRAGKLVISLSYAAKNDLLLGKMGLGDYCQHVDSFDAGVSDRAALETWKNIPAPSAGASRS